MSKIYFLIAISILIGCSSEKSCGIELPNCNTEITDIPKIDTIGQMGTAYFLNKNDLESDFIDSDTVKDAQLTFFVNVSCISAQKYRSTYLQLPSMVDSTGKVIWEYKSPYDSIQMISCFIMNCSSKSQTIQISDGKLIAIQEALNNKNKWVPIEYFEFSGCGNSYSNIIIKPKSFLRVPIYAYSGDTYTKMRLKIKSNGHFFYSNVYSGKLNSKQLIKKELDFAESYLTKGKGY